MVRRAPSAEGDAPVGRALPVDDHVAVVGEGGAVLEARLRPEVVAQRLGGHHERVHGDDGAAQSRQRRRPGLRRPHHDVRLDRPAAVSTCGPRPGVAGRMSVTSVCSKSRTPACSTASARPRASSAGCNAAQWGVKVAPEHAGRTDQVVRLLRAEPAQILLAEAERSRLVQLGQGPGTLGLAAHQVDGAALGELAVDPLGGGARTDRRRPCPAWPAAWRPWPSRPCRRASAASEVAKRAEHHPPFRPEAPKPATSRSRTTTRKAGSRRMSECAVHRPVNPAPTMQTSTARSSVSAGRGGSGAGTASHHSERR